MVALLASALLAQNADAQSQSANVFLPECQKFLANNPEKMDTRPSLFRQGECLGMIEGLTFVIRKLPPPLRSCIPKGVIGGQIVRVALAYIEQRPQRMHESFLLLVVEALHEAWPCDD